MMRWMLVAMRAIVVAAVLAGCSSTGGGDWSGTYSLEWTCMDPSGRCWPNEMIGIDTMTIAESPALGGYTLELADCDGDAQTVCRPFDGAACPMGAEPLLCPATDRVTCGETTANYLVLCPVEGMLRSSHLLLFDDSLHFASYELTAQYGVSVE